MKLLNVDWHEVFDLLPKWEALSIERRRFLITRIRAGYRARTGDATLIDLGWLEPVPTSTVVRYLVPQHRRFWVKLMRELSRAQPFPDASVAARDADVRPLEDYLLQHYSTEEISRLARHRAGVGRYHDRYLLARALGRVDWWREFLEWRAGADHDEPVLDDASGGHDEGHDNPGDGPDHADERLRELLATSVDAPDLSVRSGNCLRNVGIRTLGELTRKREDELVRVRNFGRLSLEEIRSRLQEHALHLGMTDGDYGAAPRLLAAAESVDSALDARPRRRELQAPDRWRQAPRAATTVQELIGAVTAHDGPLAIGDLLASAGDSARRDALAAALGFAFREALLLIAVDSVLVPFIGIWPPILTRLQRGRPALAEGTFASGDRLCRPFLIDDLVTLLMEAIAEPPRLRAGTQVLYDRNARAIARGLSAIPAWDAPESAPLGPDQRVARTVDVALALRLAAVRQAAAAQLVVTDRGRRWLMLPVKERLKRMLDLLRDDAKERSPTDPDYFDPWDPEHAEREHLSFLPRSYEVSAIWYSVNAGRGVSDAFRAVGRDATVDLRAFVEFHSEERNPLLDEGALVPDYRLGREGCERLWAATLLTFLCDRLLPLGGVAMGPLTDGGVGFCLTDVGRYLLGEVDDFDVESAERNGEAVIQPNFEIVFLSPSPIGQVRARTFAAPTAALRGPQSVGTLFVIDRASVQRAVAAGQDAAEVIAAAGDLSKQPLPANVIRQIRDWAAEVRWIDVRPALVVDCGEAETAARVLAAVGTRGRRLSECVELVDKADLTPAMRRKLISRGVFVRGPG